VIFFYPSGKCTPGPLLATLPFRSSPLGSSFNHVVLRFLFQPLMLFTATTLFPPSIFFPLSVLRSMPIVDSPLFSFLRVSETPPPQACLFFWPMPFFRQRLIVSDIGLTFSPSISRPGGLHFPFSPPSSLPSRHIAFIWFPLLFTEFYRLLHSNLCRPLFTEQISPTHPLSVLKPSLAL